MRKSKALFLSLFISLFVSVSIAFICSTATFGFANSEDGNLGSMSRKDYVKSLYGENKQITGSYDASLSAKCVNGTYVGKQNGNVLSYKGIPFVGAQPTGSNRWKAPVPYTADNGVYQAYYFGHSPYQVQDRTEEASYYPQGEDCLHLNVWTNTSNPDPNKPVMVWIHGGAYMYGGCADPLYDGENFVKDNPEITLVTIGYRIGVFGFLDLSAMAGGEAYPDAGNLGMLDQIMALRWVHDNIASFGGNPNNVTIFGESAGGAGVTLLPLINDARGLFKRVIGQSGTPCFTRSVADAQNTTSSFAKTLNCKSVSDLNNVSASRLMQLYNNYPLRIGPVRDGKLIPVEPYDPYKAGTAAGIEIMQGFNKDEMGYFVNSVGGPNVFENYFGGRILEKLAIMTDEDKTNALEFMSTAANIEYLKMQRFEEQAYFIAPVYRISENQSAAGGKVYQYVFRAESTLPYMGAGHAVELASVFNNLDDTVFTGRKFDETFSHTIQRMWVNFAVSGNPSLSASESPTGKAINWNEYTNTNKDMMVFDEFNIHDDVDGNLGLLDWKRMYPMTKYYMSQ